MDGDVAIAIMDDINEQFGTLRYNVIAVDMDGGTPAFTISKDTTYKS